MEGDKNRVPIFSKSITLGNIITLIAFAAAGVGVYTQIYAEITVNKAEIVALKQNEFKRDNIERDTKQDLKQDIRDVKSDVNKVNDKIDKVLYELNRRPQR